jgi:beta-galactosidase
VKDAAELVTIGSGDPTSVEHYDTDHRKAFNGKCVAYIRSNGERGTFKITASLEGLKKGEIELEAN